MEAIREAEKQLRNIEASMERLLTQIENSCIETSTKCALIADLKEMLFEIHHLVPFYSEITKG